MVFDNDAVDSGPLQLERVYHEIKWRIVHGRYRPGVALSESVLVRVHKSSRTPVREALSRLGEEGYVDRVVRRGYADGRLTDHPVFDSTADGYVDRLSANDRFHLAVAAGSQNGLLVDQVRHSLMHHNRVLSLGVEFPMLTASVPQHHAIVDAIRRRDVPGPSTQTGMEGRS